MSSEDKHMVMWLHNQARATGNSYYRLVADRLNELAKQRQEVYYDNA